MLVTRPAHQSAPLCRLLEEQGALPLAFPVLEIADPTDTTSLRATLARLEEFSLAIFVSPNAVIRAQRWLNNAGGLPPNLTLAAIGQGSANELARYGLTVHLAPTGSYDSESLLATPRLSRINGERVIIFRGTGGRELLHSELTKRGARVTYAEVYQRIKPTTDPCELHNRIAHKEMHAAIVTSSEGLHNLYSLVDPVGQAWLRDAQLIVFSERTASEARKIGLGGDIQVTTEASDAAIVAALIQIQEGSTA